MAKILTLSQATGRLHDSVRDRKRVSSNYIPVRSRRRVDYDLKLRCLWRPVGRYYPLQARTDNRARVYPAQGQCASAEQYHDFDIELCGWTLRQAGRRT